MDDRKSWDGMYALFEQSHISELEIMLAKAESREEKLMWRTLINLKLQLKQESIVGETLV